MQNEESPHLTPDTSPLTPPRETPAESPFTSWLGSLFTPPASATVPPLAEPDGIVWGAGALAAMAGMSAYYLSKRREEEEAQRRAVREQVAAKNDALRAKEAQMREQAKIENYLQGKAMLEAQLASSDLSDAEKAEIRDRLKAEGVASAMGLTTEKAIAQHEREAQAQQAKRESDLAWLLQADKSENERHSERINSDEYKAYQASLLTWHVEQEKKNQVEEERQKQSDTWAVFRELEKESYLGLIPTGKFCVLQPPPELNWGWQVPSDYWGAGWSTVVYFGNHGSIPSKTVGVVLPWELGGGYVKYQTPSIPKGIIRTTGRVGTISNFLTLVAGYGLVVGPNYADNLYSNAPQTKVDADLLVDSLGFAIPELIGWGATWAGGPWAGLIADLGSGFIYDGLIEGSNVREVIQYNLEHPVTVPPLPDSAFYPATPTALPLPNTAIPDPSPPAWLFPATPTQNPVLIQPTFSPTFTPTSTLHPTLTPTATVPQPTIQSIDSFPEAWQFPGTPTSTPSSTPSTQP
jgi:hypothetical protein